MLAIGSISEKYKELVSKAHSDEQVVENFIHKCRRKRNRPRAHSDEQQFRTLNTTKVGQRYQQPNTALKGGTTTLHGFVDLQGLSHVGSIEHNFQPFLIGNSNANFVCT